MQMSVSQSVSSSHLTCDKSDAIPELERKNHTSSIARYCCMLLLFARVLCLAQVRSNGGIDSRDM